LTNPQEKNLGVKLPTASFCLLANPPTGGVGHLKESKHRS